MLDELYQDVIMEHTTRPRHYGRISSATHTAKGYNPICGDMVIVDIIRTNDGVISDIMFEGTGCAISRAASSVMTDMVADKSGEEIEEMIASFLEFTTAQSEHVSFDTHGDMAAFSGVRKYPSRIKCANLPWHTLKAVLQGDEVATTE